MAVCANKFALGDFGKQFGRRSSLVDEYGHVFDLISNVVKLHDSCGVHVIAVGTRSGFYQINNESGGASLTTARGSSSLFLAILRFGTIRESLCFDFIWISFTPLAVVFSRRQTHPMFVD